MCVDYISKNSFTIMIINIIQVHINYTFATDVVYIAWLSIISL